MNAVPSIAGSVGGPGRWAKLVEVEGVLVLIAHRYDSESEGYKLHHLIQTDGIEFDFACGFKRAMTQAEFDQVTSDDTIARKAIEQCRVFGYEPQKVPV